MAVTKLTREENVPLQLEAGHYYRCVTPEKEVVPRGELVLITRVDDDGEVHFVSKDKGWYTDSAAFMKHYAYAPEGKAEREKELQVLLSRFADMRQEERRIGAQLENLDRPLIAAHEDVLQQAALEVAGEDELAANQNTALLVQTPDAIQARRIKRGVALVRNEALKFNKRMESLQHEIGRIKEEQEAFLEAFMKQTSGLQQMIKAAEEVIWTVNIYLGRGEEIVQIKEGVPAEAEEKISIRQLVLFADEEMAIKPLLGGADFSDLDQLDDWLLQKDNLQQVLPETRGIVAFRPRRKDKDYTGGDKSVGASLVNARYNEEDKRIYFLMRNGDNLYRVTSDIRVGDVLVPTSTEFDELFETSDYNRTTGEREVKKIKAGTKDFSRAMERASDKQRHYGRTILFLQGIIDRTKIFAPLMNESARVNLLDRKNHESYIRYIYDAQKLLPTGKLPFWKWVEQVNKGVDSGHRIIGIFNDYEHGIKRDRGRDYDRYSSRISPPKAELPPNMELHTLEGRRGSGYVIYYPRTEEVYDRRVWVPSKTREGWGHRGAYRVPKTRASCVIQRDDEFFLDFDNVEIEDMKFYLTSRVDRKNYISMFPLLETCLKLKEKETREEKPFKRLLVGLIMKEHAADREDVEGKIDELIKWWKLKNRTHRALLSQDTKAISMIVQEYGLRLKRLDEASKLDRETVAVANLIVDGTRELLPGKEVIYVAHKSGDQFVTLVAADDDDLFVHELVWVYTKTKGKVRLLEKKEWRTVDNRRMRWKCLFSGPRWDSWRLDARREQYLSQPEIDELLEGAWTKVKERITSRYDRNENSGKAVFWPLAVELRSDQELRFWYYDKKLRFDAKGHFLRDTDYKIQNPQVAYTDLAWKRKNGKAVFAHFKGIHHRDSYHSHYNTPEGPANKDWEDRPKRQVLEPGITDSRLLWTDEENIKKYEAEFESYREAKIQIDLWKDKITDPVHQSEKAMQVRWEAVKYQHYLSEDGDPELWFDELKVLSNKREFRFDADGFEKACRALVVKDIPLPGKTVEQILALVPDTVLSNVEKTCLAMDLEILPEEKVPEPEEEEESQDQDEEDDEDENDEEYTLSVS